MITITQQPSAYNLAVQPNIWTIGGLTTEDGYFITVKDYLTATPIATIKQPANPAGVAHFDVSRILQSYMFTSFYETTPAVAPTPGEVYNYYISFGTYTNNILDEVASSATKVVLNGYDSWRNLNWNDTPFNPSPDHVACLVGSQFNAEYPTEYSFLTNFPADTYKLRNSAYHTLGFFNRIANWDSFDDWELNVQPAYVRIKFYDPNSYLIQTIIYSISEDNGLGPKATFASPGPIAGGGEFYTNPQIVGQVGAGPQNLKDAGYWPHGAAAIWNLVVQTWGNYAVIWNLATAEAIVANYTVEIVSMNQCYWDAEGAPADDAAVTLEPYLGDVIYSFNFEIDDPCSAFEPITVSFLNQYGVKDYYTFDRRNTYNVNTNRQEYYKTNSTWSEAVYSINQHDGGAQTFSSKIQSNVTLSTDWMSDEVSQWLEELYTSPSVQLYIDGNWEPCVITSNNYEQKTYSRNRMFQHILTVKYANNKQVQRG